MPRSFYITTAIAYVNGDPHIGHVMEWLESDAIARYKRLMGFDVHYLVGTDENGTKNYETAQKEGIPVRDFVDRQSQSFRELQTLLNLSNSDFIRTVEDRHIRACQKLWKKLVEKGDIYKKEYEAPYCSGCEKFMLPRDLDEKGECPNHKRKPEVLKEENYFFRLSRYSAEIVRLLETGELKIVPDFRKNEILTMAREGLTDVSFSRPRSVLPWGVPVPEDSDHVMYVWCDALTNYISAVDYAGEGKLWKRWPADLHVIGKDIVRFHAGIWIGMLLSAGVPLPRAEFVHGFITHNGEKMSKTLGNVVDPHAVIEKYGRDALRYYLLREIPVGQDGDFSDALFLQRYNSDLANNLGNLVNRVHTLCTRNGITDFSFRSGHAPHKKQVDAVWKAYVKVMDAYLLHEGVAAAWSLVDYANKQMELEKPWELFKKSPEKGKAVLCNLLEVIRHISIMISPFMPETSVAVRRQIGLPAEIDTAEENGWGTLKNWKSLGAASILFPRIETA